MHTARSWPAAAWLAVLIAAAMPAPISADIRWDDLHATRLVTEGDWLGLRLEVLGQRLSFPAYRIHLRLDEDRRIAFRFLASSGLADHLTEDLERLEAEEMFTYHAEGIRAQVEELIAADFPALWARYEPDHDLKGAFLGPGEAWDDPPVTIGLWRNGRFEWKP